MQSQGDRAASVVSACLTTRGAVEVVLRPVAHEGTLGRAATARWQLVLRIASRALERCHRDSVTGLPTACDVPLGDTASDGSVMQKANVDW